MGGCRRWVVLSTVGLAVALGAVALVVSGPAPLWQALLLVAGLCGAALLWMLDLAHDRASTRALVASEAELRALLGAMTDVVLTVDARGYYRKIAPTTPRLLYRPPREMLGKHLWEIFPRAQADFFHEHIQRALRTGKPVELDYSLPINGEVLWFSAVCSPLGDDQVMLVARDVTARHQSEQREHFLNQLGRALAESLDFDETLRSVVRLSVPSVADGCAVDLLQDGTLRRMAQAHASAGGDAVLESSRPREGPRPRELAVEQEVLRTGRPVRLGPEALTTTRPLSEGWGLHALMVVPLAARGRTFGTLTFAAGSDARHFGSSELSLAEEVARRAALAIDNARLYRESQVAIQLRDEFLQVATHELKTPLTALRLDLHLLGQDEPRVQRALRKVRRLDRLVEILLDVSQISAGGLSLQRRELDLAALVRDTVENAPPELEPSETPVRLDLRGPVLGVWDPERLEQAVASVIGNALRYGQRAPIDIRVEGRDDRALITVTDHGIGIAPEDQDRIFGRFERATSTRHFGGLGLGLYVARQIVEAHGGHIQVKSAPGMGATFTLELPRVPPGWSTRERPRSDGRSASSEPPPEPRTRA